MTATTPSEFENQAAESCVLVKLSLIDLDILRYKCRVISNSSHNIYPLLGMYVYDRYNNKYILYKHIYIYYLFLAIYYIYIAIYYMYGTIYYIYIYMCIYI